MSKDENSSISKDIANIKTELKSIGAKVDLILEMFNNLTIMILEEEEMENTEEDSWIPEQREDWNSYEDDELDG